MTRLYTGDGDHSKSNPQSRTRRSAPHKNVKVSSLKYVFDYFNSKREKNGITVKLL